MRDEDLGRLIAQQLSGFELSVSAQIREGIASYCRLLLRWGERINLSGAKTVAALIADHLPDSLAIAARLAQPPDAVRIIDVGSGGGWPAIPLALLRPGSHFTLVEATAKKVAFLRAAARELGVHDRIEVQHGRIEIGRIAANLEFDGATSRAMVAPVEWMAMARGLVKKGGRVFCLASEPPPPDLPAGLELVHAASYRRERWVAELRRST